MSGHAPPALMTAPVRASAGESLASGLTLVDEGLVLQDRFGAIVSFNDTALDLLGLTGDQLLGRTSMDPDWRAVHEDGSPFPGEMHPAMVTLRTGQVVRNQVVGVHRPDGRLTWLLVTSTPMRDESGAVSMAVTRFTDLTRQREAEQQRRRSEAMLSSIGEMAQVGFYVTELATGRWESSPVLDEIFGIDATFERTIPNWGSLIVPEHRQRLLDHYADVVANQKPFCMEYEVLRPCDGTMRWVDARGEIEYDAGGAAVRLMGGIRDITEQKRAEVREVARAGTLALMATGGGLRAVLESIVLGVESESPGVVGSVLLVDESGSRLRVAAGPSLPAYFNQAVDGLPIAAGSGTCGMAAFEGRPVVSRDISSDPGWAGLHGLAARAGLASCWSEPIRGGSDRVLGTFALYHRHPMAPDEKQRADLTAFAQLAALAIERQRTDEALHMSERRFRSLVEGVPNIAVQGYDQQRRVVFWNAASEALYGFTATEALGRPLEELIIPHPMRGAVVNAVEAWIRDGTPVPPGELVLQHKNGSPVHVFSSHVMQMNSRGEPEMYCIDIDVSERKRAAQQVVEQAHILDEANDAILVRDLNQVITYWNRSSERLYGWTAAEAVGRSARELLYGDPDPFDTAMDELHARDDWRGELSLNRKDGTTVLVESHWSLIRDAAGQPSSVLVINADITQRKELERQFLRSQRLESIGTLAGGIAHDLNNMLAPIVMSLDLLKPRLTDEDGREILETISSSAQRSAELVRQVLWFARGVHGERVPVPLAQLVGELERFISDTFPRNILHRMELSADLPEVNGDATQLHQVLLNLCLNARDAMPAGGTLTLRAERVTVDAPYAAMNPGAVPGEYVALRVEDNGTGIPRETLDRIFEPFFTTKEVGKGTGLGLSTTLGIVKSHGGFVQVDSKPGRGSVFTVNLPAHPVGGQTAGEVPAPVPTHGRGELVLLVDDEESILRISRQALEAFGYRVLTAANGTEALAEFVTHQDEIAVVVTDMMMPEMDGTAVVRALKRMAPKVPVIRSSGLGSSPGGLSMAEDGLGPFLPKPYTAERLLRVLDEVLQREGTPV